MGIFKDDGKVDTWPLLVLGLLVFAPGVALASFCGQLWAGNSFSGAISEAGTALAAGGVLWLWPWLFVSIMAAGEEGIASLRHSTIAIGSGIGPPFLLSIGVVLDPYNLYRGGDFVFIGVFDNLPDLLLELAKDLPLLALGLAVLNFIFIRIR